MTALSRPAGGPQGRSATGRWWLVTAAALLGIAATASLGRWQLDRAAQKQALAAAIEARGQRAPLDGMALLQALDACAAPSHASQAPEACAAGLAHRPVGLQGQWLAQHTVYLDNRQMHGRPGFFVITPLELALPAGQRAVVLVQRGWVPRNFQDRTALPPVQSPAGRVALNGCLAAWPARLYEFVPGADPVPETSHIRQNLDKARFRAETGLPLLDLSVVQTGAASEGLQRDWPRVEAGVDKHYGYAFQWFGLSVLMAVLYVWFQLVRRFFRPRSRPTA